MKRQVLAGFLLLVAVSASAAFQGNPNFRDVAVTNAAQYRSDWRSCAADGAMDWSRAETLRDGVVYLPLRLTVADGWARQMYAHAVRVDTSNRNLRFTGSDRCEGWGQPNWEFNTNNTAILKNTVREKTADFLARFRGARALGGREMDMVFAVNGQGWGGTYAGVTYTFTSGWAMLNSIQYSEGVLISNEKRATGHGSYCPGVFVVWKDGTIDIVDELAAADVPRVWCAITPHICRLMTDGEITVKHYAGGEYVEYTDDTTVRPRTAYGISADRRYFYAVVLDGDNGDTWSAGATCRDTAKVMKAAGCHQALNMDGGGSSNIVGWDAALNRPKVLGQPSGGFSVAGQRDGGSQFGIYLAPITFGTNAVRVCSDDRTAVVRVAVAGVAPAVLAENPKLALTVTSDDGTSTNVYEQALSGAGTYSFRPTGAGFGYSYRVTLVDGAGKAVTGADAAEGVFTFGTETDWFAADCGAGTVTGGNWTGDGVFTATEGGKTGRVRIVSEVVLDDACVSSAEMVAQTLSAHADGASHAALMLQENGSGGFFWQGLVKEGDAVCWHALSEGETELGDSCDYTLISEIDFSSGRPRVRYFAGPKASGAATLLADAAGNTAFDGAGSATGVSGVVRLEQFAGIRSLVGSQRLKVDRSGTIFLLGGMN